MTAGDPAGANPEAARFRVCALDRRVPTSVALGDGVLEEFLAGPANNAASTVRRLFVVDAGVATEDVQRGWGKSRVPLDDALVVPAGERSKTREVKAKIEDAALARGWTRSDVIVAIGGGAVLDVVGFAASTIHRGLPWIAIPTSVVAMADASVGGKTAINHPMGKNLLGAIHPPTEVFADVRTLATLPPREFVSGLAEIYKAGVVGDPRILAIVRARVPIVGRTLVELLQRAVRVKAQLVEADLHDTGVRRALNYGHTAGHALETVLGPDAMRHGEAVAIGMGVAAQIARVRGLVDADFVSRQDADLSRLGLPVSVPRSADGARVRTPMLSDKKKAAGDRHTMVLPQAAGGVVIVDDVAMGEIDAALDARRASG